MYCMCQRTNSEFCPVQHSMIGFYKRDGKCVLRRTHWVFKQNGLHFVLEGLI